MALTETQLTRYYGAPGEVDRVTVLTPWGIKVQSHAKVASIFRAACYEADEVSSWKPLRIDSYVNRAIRGSTTPSKHARALAWDFFATPPGVVPPGGVWTPDNALPKDFAHPFTRRGFTWGAVWTRQDIPHIEWNEAPPTAINPPEADDMTPEQDQLLRDVHKWMSDQGKPMAEQVAQILWRLAVLENEGNGEPVSVEAVKQALREGTG